MDDTYYMDDTYNYNYTPTTLDFIKTISEDGTYSQEDEFKPKIPKLFDRHSMYDFLVGLANDEIELWQVKNRDYTSGSGDEAENPFANFDVVAAELGIKPELVLWIYFRKGIQALLRYVLHGKVEAEPLKSRIMDARIYLALLGGLAARNGDIKYGND